MPREVAPPKKAPTKKGSPMGIPKWGWIVGIALGILVAYVIMKRSSNAAVGNGGTQSGSGTSIPSGTDSGSGGGVVASPPPDLTSLLEALALSNQRGGGGNTVTSQSGVTPGPNDTATDSQGNTFLGVANPGFGYYTGSIPSGDTSPSPAPSTSAPSSVSSTSTPASVGTLAGETSTKTQAQYINFHTAVGM